MNARHRLARLERRTGQKFRGPQLLIKQTGRTDADVTGIDTPTGLVQRLPGESFEALRNRAMPAGLSGVARCLYAPWSSVTTTETAPKVITVITTARLESDSTPQRGTT